MTQTRKRWDEEASLSDIIISHLLGCGSRSIQREVLYKLVCRRRALSRRFFNKNLHWLKNKGAFDLTTDKSITFDKNTLRLYTLFSRIKAKPAGSTRIMVLFDIPEKKRKIRSWLRSQLRLWDFEMLQQSVWLGKGPLPGEFMSRLKLLDAQECVKIFKIQSGK